MGDENAVEFRAYRRASLGLRAPCQVHSETSVVAARRIDPQLNALQERVLSYLRECGATGATDEEMQLGLDMNPSTQRPRRIELLEQRRIFASEERRPTRSGRPATVWMARESVYR